MMKNYSVPNVIPLPYTYGQRGYRKISWLMRNGDWQLVTPQRVQHISQDEGLKVGGHELRPI